MRVQTTSTQQKLGTGPRDMPDRGGQKPKVLTSSTMCDLSRKENPVAAFGARPGMGKVITTSTEVKLSRTASSPYEKLNATTGQHSFPNKRGARK